MKQVLKVSLLTLLGLFLLFAGAVTWLVNDEALLRSQVERFISRTAGREVIIGELRLDLGKHTRIQVNDVQLDNAAWGLAENLVAIGGLDATIDARRLFRGEVTVESLEVEDVRLNLEEDESGQVNWQLGGEKGDENEARSGTLLPWARLRLTRFELTHLTPSREVPLEFRVDELIAEQASDGRVDLQGNGVIGRYPLSVDGFIDPLHALISGGVLAHRLVIDLGEIRLLSEGTIEDAATGEGANIDAHFSGPEIGWVLAQAALPDFSAGAFDARLSLDVADDASIAVDLDGDLGSFAATASGRLDRLVHPSLLDLEFDVAGPDLQALGQALAVEDLPGAPYRFSGDARFADQTLRVSAFDAEIGQDRLTAHGIVGPWPELAGTALDITASGADISAWGPAIGFERWRPNPFALEGRFYEQDGQVAFSGTKLTVGEGRLELDGVLGALPDFVGAHAKLQLQAPDISALVNLEGFAERPQVAATLQGTVSREQEGVHLENIVLDAAGNRFSLESFVAFQAGTPPPDSRNWPSRLSGSHVKARIHLPNVRAFGELIGRNNFPDQPLAIRLDARLDRNGLAFDVADGNLGEIDLELKGLLPRLPAMEGARLDFRLRLPSLDLAEGLLGDMELPDLPGRVAGSARRVAEGFEIEGLLGEAGEAQFGLDGLLVTEPIPVLRNARFSASGPDFRQFIDDESLAGLPGRFHVSGDFVSEGTTEHLNSLIVQLGAAELAVEGVVHNVFDLEFLQLHVHFASPGLGEFQPYLARFTGIPPPTEPVSLDFQLRADRESAALTELRAVMGESDVRGQLAIAFGDVPEYRGQFGSRFLDLAWMSPPEASGAKGAAEKSVAREEGKSAQDSRPRRLFSDEPLPLLEHEPVTADLSLEVGELRLPLVSLWDVALGLKMTERSIVLEPLRVSGAAGERLTATIALEESGGKVDTRIKAAATQFRLGLAVTEDQDVSTSPPWDVRLVIQSRGASMHELAIAAAGDVELILGQGQVFNNRLDLVFSDLLLELFTTINPFAKSSPHTRIDCGVLVADIAGGKALVNPMIIQTDKIVATSKGVIDLDSEQIDLSFNTRPRTGIGVSPGMVINPFLKLGGTLAQPSMSLDAPSAAITGGAAVVTSGLSLLGKSLFDRYLRESDPCGKVVAELRRMHASDKPEAGQGRLP